jgi:hypothetical protein
VVVRWSHEEPRDVALQVAVLRPASQVAARRLVRCSPRVAQQTPVRAWPAVRRGFAEALAPDACLVQARAARPRPRELRAAVWASRPRREADS